MLRRIFLAFVTVILFSACSLPSDRVAPTSFAPPSSITPTLEPTQPATVAVEVQPTETETLPPTATLPFVNATPAGDIQPAETVVLPTETQTVMQPTAQPLKAPAPQVEQLDAPQYVLQSGTPAASPNFVHPDLGCNWLGIGGQVFDAQGLPVTGLIVEVTGKIEGKDVVLLGLTGNVQVLGPGGYEVKLADRPVETMGTLRVQLFDVQGKALSNQLYFDTSTDCNRNFTLINFAPAANQVGKIIYLPYIFKKK